MKLLIAISSVLQLSRTIIAEQPPVIQDVYIHDIQGTDDRSPYNRELVRIAGIVTGDFQDNDDDDPLRNLGGFYVQHDEIDYDNDPLTSEGIFVYDDTRMGVINVKVGDVVECVGVVDEYFHQTQITIDDEVDGSDVIILNSSHPLPAYTPIELLVSHDIISVKEPAADDAKHQPNLEAYEGMLVSFPETLTITDMYNLDRFNEIRLVAGERPYQFTQQNEPNVTGYQEHLESIGKRSIMYDDGESIQNAPIGNLEGFGPVYNTANAPRLGDTITGLHGVLTYSFDAWRVRTVGVDDEGNTNSFVSLNPRPERIPIEPTTSRELKMVSLNVFNFFTTIDDGTSTSGPDGLEPRGADSVLEYERQLSKTLTAMLAMDADIYGLVELENEFGYDRNGDGVFAINEIVLALNDDAENNGGNNGNAFYRHIDPRVHYVGNDAISCGFVFRPARVILMGTAAILDGSVDDRFVDDKNRPVVAQSFRLFSSHDDDCITLAVAHLKSKGSDCDDYNDPDLNDGAGNCNMIRTNATLAMIDWLDTDPTQQGCPTVAIMGDLNSYAHELPIRTLVGHGYRNVESDDAYSYAFDGQIGTLDYFLIRTISNNEGSNSSSTSTNGNHDDDDSDAVLADVWHINEDEADSLDYNLDYGRDPTIFDGTSPARHSDHSPIIVLMDTKVAPGFDTTSGCGRVVPQQQQLVVVIAVLTCTMTAWMGMQWL